MLTVPSHFGQAERRRLIQVSEIAGLNVLQIINDNSAVALNFGLLRFKSFNETPQYYMFFDIGSMSTTATLAGQLKLLVTARSETSLVFSCLQFLLSVR